MLGEPRDTSENLSSTCEKEYWFGSVREWDHLNGAQSSSSLTPLTNKETESQTCPKPGSWLLAKSGKVLAFGWLVLSFVYNNILPCI